MRKVEVAALWQLYEQTNGENWTKNDNWDLANDPCRLFHVKKPYLVEAPVVMTDEWYKATPWFGISCSDPCDDYLDGDNCYHGRATALRLRQNGLNGSLNWTRVGAMANLTYIDLAYNSISGSLPSQLGMLNNVEFLQFSNTPLVGVLPTELGQLNSHGGRNYSASPGWSVDPGCDPDHASCEPPQPKNINAHIQLRELTLQDTFVSGSVPSQLGALTRLQYLDVARARLSGTLPSHIAQLTALQVLYLSENRLSGSIPPLLGTNMSEVRYLQLQHNHLGGQMPHAFGGMTALTQLLLHENDLDGTIPTQIGLLTSLRSALTLNDNAISGSIPSEIGELRTLHLLDLFGNRLQGDPPASIANLINLKQLYLDKQQLTPLLIWHCRERMPPVDKYNWRILREDWHRISQAYCADPFTIVEAFGTLDEIEAELYSYT